ncbi:hypothetical protein CPI84_18255 [Erwinia pyrifoliae]|nr:hypothetical protein CPI84_18255 [Erwinia pyrifoliae]MCA8875434.1 hypothetical protein [Erwinia pyrifoliae]
MGCAGWWFFTVSYPVISGFNVRGRIVDLFDKSYETAYGYENPGREYHFRRRGTFCPTPHRADL